jgi:hypothetical protein
MLLPNAGPESLRVRGAQGGRLSVVVLLPTPALAAVVSTVLIAVLAAMPPAPTVTSGAVVLLLVVVAVVGASMESECCSGSDNGLFRVVKDGDTPVEVELEVVSSGALAAVDVLQSIL